MSSATTPGFHRRAMSDASWSLGHGSMNKLNPGSLHHRQRHDVEPERRMHLSVPWANMRPFESRPPEMSRFDGLIVRLSRNKKLMKDHDRWNKHLNWATDQNPDGVPIVHEAIDQGPCGSCWALAATGSLEANAARQAAFLTYQNHLLTKHSHHNKKINVTEARIRAQAAESKALQTLNLSIQELLDCDTTADQGCTGGNPLLSFHFIHRYGLVDASSYPYEGREGECQTHNKSQVRIPVATSQSWAVVPTNHENYMELALRFIGPLAVGIRGDSASFLNYRGGIYEDPHCRNNNQNNHALLVVGYGEETVRNNTVRYWIARNSWGKHWGEGGFVRIRRGSGRKGYPGVCGIATNPSVAIGGRFISPQEQELLNEQGAWAPQDLEDPVFTYCKTKHTSLARQKACLRWNGIFTAYRAWFLGAIAVTFVLLASCPLTRDCRRRRKQQLERKKRAVARKSKNAESSKEHEYDDEEIHESTPLTVAGSFPPRYSAHAT